MSINKQVAGVLIKALDGSEVELASLWKNRKVAIIWLRHYGQQAATMAKIKPLFEKKEVTMVAIGNGNVRMANAFVEEVKFEGEIYTDPELHSYKALNFKKSNGFSTLFSASMWKKAYSAFKKGFRQAKTQGDSSQLGGVLIVEPEDHVLYTHAETFAGDHAPVESLLKAVGFDKETIKEELKVIFPNNEHKEKKTPRDETEA